MVFYVFQYYIKIYLRNFTKISILMLNIYDFAFTQRKCNARKSNLCNLIIKGTQVTNSFCVWCQHLKALHPEFIQTLFPIYFTAQ